MEKDETITLISDCLRILEFSVKNAETVENNRHKEENARIIKDGVLVFIIAATIVILNLI